MPDLVIVKVGVCEEPLNVRAGALIVNSVEFVS